MNQQFYILMKKERVQIFRDFRIVWMPLIFIFLGATQPIITYFLPSILGSMGGTQGITIDPNMVQQDGGQVLASTIGSQFDQLGIIIIVVSMMGIIQSDKANGMLDFILTRPVTVGTYISGKTLSSFLFVATSITIGYFISYLYVSYLFNSIPFSRMLMALVFYLVWALFMISFTTMISTIFNGQGIIAMLSIVFLLIIRLICGLHSINGLLNPAGMSQHATELLITGSVDSSLYGNIFITLIWILLTLKISHYWISQKKYHTN